MTSIIENSKPKFLEYLEQGYSRLFLFYGTSLTEGGTWSRHLMDRLQKSFPGLVSSLNTAKGGEMSIWGLANFQERVLTHKPDVLFMEFTINDAVTRFHIPLEESKRNLETMLDSMALHLPDTEIILQIMNPCIDRPEGHLGHRGNLPQYCDQWREIARQRNLRLIDHWPAWSHLLETDEPTFRRYVPDGLHPADEGYLAIVMPTLYKELHIPNTSV